MRAKQQQEKVPVKRVNQNAALKSEMDRSSVWKKSQEIDVAVLGLAACHVQKENDWQVRDKGVPSSYHHGKAVSSLVDDCQTMHPPPARKMFMKLQRRTLAGKLVVE